MKAEILTLRSGPFFMWELNLREAICEVDCLKIVNTLRDDRFQYHELASEIWSLLHRPWNVQLEHILRSANDAVDCLIGLEADLQCVTLHLETLILSLIPS